MYLPYRRICAAFAVTTALVVPFAAQPAPPPGIQDALRIQQSDPAGAARILEGVAQREPRNATARRLLGVALQQSKQLDKALDAYRAALEIQSEPTAMFNIGTVYALKGDPDRAFEWLGRARATRRMDMTAIQVDADLAALKDDPRFAALLPAPADFEKPFVEETQVLHEWHGESINATFGWIARAIGDVDGDKVDDFVTSANGMGGGAAPPGRLYAYSSKSGRLLWKVDGAAGDRLGTSLEAAGDVNRDGTGDVVANAGGRVTVFSGRDGAVVRTFTADPAAPSWLSSAAGAGDVNGDGHADIIAGAPPPPQGANAPGAGGAFVFSGKDGTILFRFSGERAGDRFGSAVAGFSDGKTTLLAVGAPGAGPNRTGRVYVYAGAGEPRFVIESDDTGGALGGMFVSIAGDVDADGVVDVFASDFINRAKGPSTGRVYVHSGKTGTRILTLTGQGPGEGFGTSASKAGDINGDGHADLAVGAWQHAGAATSGGRIYVHSGKDGALLRTITGRIVGETLGFDSVGIGDTDGDGTIDLLLTSAYSGIKGFHSGRVFIVSSGIKPGATSQQPAPQTQPARHPALAALEQAIAGKEQQPAEQVFKNIQTFKGMPAIRVLRIMEQAFVPNLGVTCTHCHVEGAWESDEKNPKGIARRMWAMRAEWQDEVRKASGNAQAVVTCYTCHKGQPKPAFAPAR